MKNDCGQLTDTIGCSTLLLCYTLLCIFIKDFFMFSFLALLAIMIGGAFED